MKDFSFQKVPLKPWTCQVIQGHCENHEQIFYGRECNLVLISRRRFAMAGTRFNARGIDEEGNAANFVESEMIVECRSLNLIFSHLQIRGSIPIFWTQKVKKQKVVISNVSDKQLDYAFDQHINDMLTKYSLIVFLNLLSKEKQSEDQLTKRTKQLLDKFNYERVKPFHFDFHQETAGDNFTAVLDELASIVRNNVLKTLGYFAQNSQTGQQMVQKGVYRTNCLDCLDRTNVTQARISLLVLQDIL